MNKPWRDWIPGALGKPQIRKLAEDGFLLDANLDALDHSSIDLHLSTRGWRLLEGSIKPNGDGSYLHFLERGRLIEPLAPTADAFILEPKNTYLFQLKERISRLGENEIHGQATAKSSVGRVDVLARLVVDGMDGYEGFRPNAVGNGDMFLELTPMTFRIAVQAGTPLTQLRFFYGRPEASEISGPELWKNVLIGDADEQPDGMLSLDLNPTVVAGRQACAFRAGPTKPDDLPIQLWKYTGEKPSPRKYWELEKASDNRRLKIQHGSFYILRSRERMAVPKGIAVYCRAIDETIGEMRIHYAGFVHPFFGLDRGDGTRGTPLIFEVRGHDVDANLIHGEKMARMTFYRMSEDAVPDQDTRKQAYNEQTLKLSTFFGDWT